MSAPRQRGQAPHVWGQGSISRSSPVPKRSRGFSYVEVLVAAALIAIALVPAMEALDTGLASATAGVGLAARHQRLRGKMEEVLAEPFAALEAEASPPLAIAPSAAYSDPGGTADRRLVEIAPFDGDDADTDGDPFTGTDADLLWVRVRIENGAASLASLVTR